MKSPAERKAERERRERIEKMKRSVGKKKYHHFRIPIYGYPHIHTEGDKAFLKKKADALLSYIRENSPWQFYEYLKMAIESSEGLTLTYVPKPAPQPATSPVPAIAPTQIVEESADEATEEPVSIEQLVSALGNNPDGFDNVVLTTR